MLRTAYTEREREGMNKRANDRGGDHPEENTQFNFLPKCSI